MYLLNLLLLTSPLLNLLLLDSIMYSLMLNLMIRTYPDGNFDSWGDVRGWYMHACNGVCREAVVIEAVVIEAIYRGII